MKKMLPVIGAVIFVLLVGGAVAWYTRASQLSNFQRSRMDDMTTIGATMTPSPMSVSQKEVIAKDQQAHSALALIISTPASGITVKNPSLAIKGKTSPGAEVFVNEMETRADAAGNFSVTMTLDEGENPIIIMANDEQGNVAEKELTITYDSGQ